MSTELPELYRERSLVYKVLTPAHRDATAVVLARAFCTEPVCAAIADIRPEMKTNFVDYWMDHCSTNGLSVIAIDEKNHRVAAQKVYPPLAQAKSGDACDLWFLGVHPDYRGLKIANHLMRQTVPLVKNAGFKFATVEGTSAFTSKAAAYNKFQALVHVKAKNWLWKDNPLYVNAPLPHGVWTFWIKDLQ